MWDICGAEIAPGEKRRIELEPVPGYKIPATAVCGNTNGKTVLVTAGVHGDEYPGIAASIRVAGELNPEEMSGNVLFVHCVNVSGFYGKNRRVPEDGGNLNADFPGKRGGTVSEQIADFFVSEIFPKADFVLDLHSGSISEPLTPCLFFPGSGAVHEVSLAAAREVNVPYLIASSAKTGLYSWAAASGIPGMLIERGHSGECREEWVSGAVGDIYLLLSYLGVTRTGKTGKTCVQQVCTDTIYLEADVDGLWYASVSEGQTVKAGDVLGRIESFYGDVLKEYRAEKDGVVFYYTSGLPIKKGDALVAYGTAFEN